MGLIAGIGLAFRTLAANKLRSFLTMLGIIIGVASVIVLVSIGNGVKISVDNQIESLGSNLVIVLPGQQNRITGTVGGALSTLTIEDAKEIQKKIREIKKVTAVLESGVEVAYKGKALNTLINGTDENYPTVRNHEVAIGRFLAVADLKEKRSVAVLGVKVKEDLFGEENPLGREIKINKEAFKVIGVMKSKGRAFTIDNDDRIFIPVERAQALIETSIISTIFVQTSSSGAVDEAIKDVSKLLEKRHGKRDFSVSEQQDILQVFEEITATLTGMLLAITAVSLTVGGIGIMNIMLVSITERTREIGLRKAVGAKEKDILYQFLVESTVLSVLGGLFGVLIGLAGSGFIGLLTESLQPVISGVSVIVALLFSIFVGLIFGIYPAKRAAALNPIEALRYE